MWRSLLVLLMLVLVLPLIQLARLRSLPHHPLGKDLESQEAPGLLRQPRKGLEVRLHNITLAGTKLRAYLDEMEKDQKPGLLCLTETHLMGLPLNKARRRARSLGWHWFSTPATAIIRDTVEEEVGRVADAREVGTFANHGGEAILALPKLVVTGHHQDAEAYSQCPGPTERLPHSHYLSVF